MFSDPTAQPLPSWKDLIHSALERYFRQFFNYFWMSLLLITGVILFRLFSGFTTLLAEEAMPDYRMLGPVLVAAAGYAVGALVAVVYLSALLVLIMEEENSVPEAFRIARGRAVRGVWVLALGIFLITGGTGFL